MNRSPSSPARASSLRAFWLHGILILIAGGGAYLLRPVLEPALVRQHAEAVGERAPAAAETAPPLPLPESSAGLPDFLVALRSAGPAQLRTAFLSTREPALREAITIRWGAVDPAGCWRFLEECSEQRPLDHAPWWNCMPLLIEQWVKSDPRAAREALAQRRPTESNALAALLRATAREGGKAWQELLEDPRFLTAKPPMSDAPVLPAEPGSYATAMDSMNEAYRQGRRGMFFTMREFVHGGSAGEAEDILQRYQSMEPGARSWFVPEVAGALAGRDPQQAVEFADSLVPHERARAAQSIAGGWARKEPQAAWDWLSTRLPGSGHAAAESWARSVVPAEGAAVMTNQPPSPLRDTAIAKLSDRWMESDASAAAAWITSLTDPDTRRTAIRSIARDWARKAPRDALEGLTAADAPTLSAEDYRSVANTLKREDPALAGEFIRRLPPVAAKIASEAINKESS